MTARGSEVPPELCASLSKEQGENALISLLFYPEHSFFETQHESSPKLLLKLAQADSWDSLDSDGIPPLLNAHVHTPNDSGPPPDPRMVHKASEMVKKEKEMNVFLLK